MAEMESEEIGIEELIDRIDAKMAGRRAVPEGYVQLEAFAGRSNAKRALMVYEGEPMWIQLVRMRVDASDPENITLWTEPGAIETARQINQNLAETP